MKATIIYDNTACRKDLKADWGFSAFIEAKGRRILFDTGQSGSILLANMKKLEISPETIDDIFISHAHFDHVGGLSAFLDRNNAVRVWVPDSIRGVRNAKEVTCVKNSVKLYDGIYSTGELAEIEQSLCIETQNGIVIIAGCSHPPIGDIIDAASKFGSVWGIIGGLHGNLPASLEKLEFICATHCTVYRQQIKQLFPDHYIEGGTGKVIELP